MELFDTIKKYALQNAVKFKGKATLGAVIGKVLGEKPEYKDQIKKLSKEINEIIEEVNSLSFEDQQKQLEEYQHLLTDSKKEERDLFSVFNIQKGEKVIAAFPPEPSKYPHIGHAKAILLNYELAKRHSGKFILRFEDTNPELAKEEFYDIHLDNYRWLGVEPDEIVIVSDYMDEFYKRTQELIDKGHAYVDRASQDEVKKSRMNAIPTKDRNNSISENQNLWKQMQTATEGSCIVRLKIDLAHKNSTMRDPTIMRIIDAAHCRTRKKYRIWPNYDFENAIMDGVHGITHRLRTKEFELRNELQGYIQQLFGFNRTKIAEFARFNMEGVESSGRIIRELIEKKQLTGWDDPSLTTLVALRRRGFAPAAIKQFVLFHGISKAEATLTWDDLIVHNKRYLDGTANRYFFIHDQKEISIENAPEQVVSLPLHPELKEKGSRNFKTKTDFAIERDDFNKLQDGKMYRLMDCLNFEKKGSAFVFHSTDYESFRQNGHIIMHWLPRQGGLIQCHILMPDKKIISGMVEPSAAEIDENDVIQFQRFGFCRLDKKEKGKLHFWFTHK